MKRLLIAAALVATLTACTSRTEYGDCIGLGEDKDPALVYKASAWNLVVGAIFIETIVVPVLVAVNQFYCPVGKKSA